jgi:hypothetical protein
VSPKYPASTPPKCLTSPSRLVPVGVNGRRMSYSESPSSSRARPHEHFAGSRAGLLVHRIRS